MTKMRTVYRPPSWWRHPYMQWYRAYKLRKWRDEGYKAFRNKMRKHFTGYTPIQKHETYKRRQGVAWAYIKRVRLHGNMVITKPQLTDDYLTGIMS